jgi:hypothetical protein
MKITNALYKIIDLNGKIIQKGTLLEHKIL